jgi:undecaprenyl diphosphate synthase
VVLIIPKLNFKNITMTSKLNPKFSIPTRIPRHVAVIMDGNGRWATQRGLPRIAGHRQGAQTLKKLLRACNSFGIKTLSAYAFSTENWGRPFTEVDFLMILFERLLKTELAQMQQEEIRLQVIGDLTILPPTLQAEIERVMAITAENQGIQFNVAINYGSRQEILQVCQKLAKQVQRGELQPDEINETRFQSFLNTSTSPDPDLLIRTSGEMRLSNFLLWQMAYTEMYFTKTLWPDFNTAEFYRALIAYQERDRRFGQLSLSS